MEVRDVGLRILKFGEEGAVAVLRRRQRRRRTSRGSDGGMLRGSALGPLEPAWMRDVEGFEDGRAGVAAADPFLDARFVAAF